MHLSCDHCSALRERMGMDCLVSPMRSVVLIALTLDCGGRREPEKGSKGEGGRGKQREKVLQECIPRELVLGWGRASGMLPRRSQ